MSFYTEELSNENGAPIRLYEFNRETLFWYYTNADRDIEWNGNTYVAVPISDGGIVQSGEAQSNAFQVTMPTGLPVVEMYRHTPPSDTIFLTVRSTHEFDSLLEAPVQLVSYITEVQRPQVDTAQVICATLSASFQRPGLRLTWMRTCPHALYDRNCTVDKLAFAVGAAITTMTGTQISADSLAGYEADWFSGGYLEWEIASGVYERRGIELHTSGGVLNMFGTTDGMSEGLLFTVYPGCTRTIQVCHDKFDNQENYGGVPGLPGKSPFDGDPVFNV